MQNGCQNCVWEVYRVELGEYNAELARRQGRPPPKPVANPFADLERKIQQQEKARQALESSAPKTEKRTGHAKDSP